MLCVRCFVCLTGITFDMCLLSQNVRPRLHDAVRRQRELAGYGFKEGKAALQCAKAIEGRSGFELLLAPERHRLSRGMCGYI